MNTKFILGLLMSANVGLLLPIVTPSATAAVVSESMSTRKSSIEIDVVDLNRRGSSELILAENSSSNSSSDSSSNSSSNESSNSSSNESSNSSSNESSNSSSNESSNTSSNSNSNSDDDVCYMYPGSCQ